jgi:hypothetical protein
LPAWLLEILLQRFLPGGHLFKEVAGDLPVGSIGRDDMRAVRDVAQRLPAGWRKLKQYPRHSCRGLMAR